MPRTPDLEESPTPAALGFDPARLARVSAAIEDDVARERYDGAVLLVAREGTIVLHRAFGDSDRARARRARRDDVFPAFSITKTFTAVMVLRRVERGELTLDTPVAAIVPEFGVRGKQRITIAHLLTHTSGIAGAPPMIPLEQFGALETMVAAIADQTLEAVPGSEVSYSALNAHAVLAEVVRRLDGGRRRFRDLLADEILTPLSMRDSWLGARADLADRRVPIVVRDRSPGLFQPDLLEAFNVLLDEESELPAAGLLTTAADLFRFAESLRGNADLPCLLSPATMRLATTNQTGPHPNRLWSYARELCGWPEFPAFVGLTFWLRGTGTFPTPFGTLASPGTFGHPGAGSTLYWVDRERALTFVFLTAGLIEETRSVERFQRVSDLVIAALND
jgi:CubicO group peptidase (beta-lactamase class C family)